MLLTKYVFCRGGKAYKLLLFLEEEGMTFSQSTSKTISPSLTLKFISVLLYQFP